MAHPAPGGDINERKKKNPQIILQETNILNVETEEIIILTSRKKKNF